MAKTTRTPLISPVKGGTAIRGTVTTNIPQNSPTINPVEAPQQQSSSGTNWANVIADAAGPLLMGVLGNFTEPEDTPNQLYNTARAAMIGSSDADPTMRLISDLSGLSVRPALDAIEADSRRQFSAGDNTILLEQANNMDLINKVSPYSGRSIGGRIADNLMASGKGAMGGAVGGPWGALIGGIAGGAVNIVSQATEGLRAKKLNRGIEEANMRKLSNFDAAVNRTNQQQQFQHAANYFPFGGMLSNHGGDFTNGITHFNTGGTHESNPYMGIMQGMDAQGTPNFVEEGEVKWEDYIFSNRLKPKKKALSELGWEKYHGKTFAEIAEKLSKESEERPSDPISKRGLEDSMLKLMFLQEDSKPQPIMETNPMGLDANVDMNMGGGQDMSMMEQPMTGINPEMGMAEEPMGMMKPGMNTMMDPSLGMRYGGHLFPAGGFLYEPTYTTQDKIEPIIAPKASIPHNKKRESWEERLEKRKGWADSMFRYTVNYEHKKNKKPINEALRIARNKVMQMSYESEFGESNQARTKNNFSGIRAYDHNPRLSTKYNTIDDYFKDKDSILQNNYPQALNSLTPYDYLRNLKNGKWGPWYTAPVQSYIDGLERFKKTSSITDPDFIEDVALDVIGGRVLPEITVTPETNSASYFTTPWKSGHGQANKDFNSFPYAIGQEPGLQPAFTNEWASNLYATGGFLNPNMRNYVQTQFSNLYHFLIEKGESPEEAALHAKHMVIQMANESAYGLSKIAVDKKNHAGLNATDKDPYKNAYSYDTINDFYEGFYKFLNKDRYRKVYQESKNFSEYAHGLKKAGYFTAPPTHYLGTEDTINKSIGWDFINDKTIFDPNTPSLWEGKEGWRADKELDKESQTKAHPYPVDATKSLWSPRKWLDIKVDQLEREEKNRQGAWKQDWKSPLLYEDPASSAQSIERHIDHLYHPELGEKERPDWMDSPIKSLSESAEKGIYDRAKATMDTARDDRMRLNEWNHLKSKKDKGVSFDETLLRYAPAVGSAIGLGLASRPIDYSNAQQIERSYSPVGFTPDSSYMQYRPIDQTLPSIMLANQAAANRAALGAASGGNRVALQNTLLASNYQTQQALGNLALESQNANQERRAQAEAFNREVRQANMQAGLQTAMYNSEARQRAQMAGAELRERLREERDNDISANLSALFQNLGAIGRQQYGLNTMTSNPFVWFQYDKNGNMIRKPE